MRHKRANRMAQQARILSIINIKYRWKPPAASLDIENENIQLRHENSTATSRNNFSASTVLNDCAHFLHHSKFDTTEISTGGGSAVTNSAVRPRVQLSQAACGRDGHR